MTDNKKQIVNKYSIDKLREVMKILRSDNGCPWDRKQTITSLKPYIIEEAHEVVEAMDESVDELSDELGDLLLQVVFVSQIASEDGLFSFDDVCEKISDKLIRRHPHVFANTSVDTAEQVVTNWNKIKKDTENKKYLLDGIPTGMPAMLLAQRYADRAASVGFDWEKWDDVLGKIEEEIGELRESIAQKDKNEIFHEMGDVLFAVVNLARKLGVNSEDSLKACAKRFRQRFNKMEDLNIDIHDNKLSLDEMESLWQEAKKLLSKTK